MALGFADVSVLVPAYNGEAWIRGALESLPGGVETVVVDNGSTDATPAICEARPGVRLLKNGANHGFSQAVNRAAREASGRLLVVINQDLRLQPGSLTVLVRQLERGPAVVGGRLLSAPGRIQPSCGPFPSLASTLARLALPRPRRKYYLRRAAGPSPAAVDWVTGAYMAFPREVFDAVGGFDEGFFMYYEDVDFCLRARQKGYPAFFLPEAEAVHSAPYAERSDAPEWLRKEIRISQMRFFEKHRPGWEAAAIRRLNRAYFLTRGWDWPPVGKAAAA